MREPVVMGDSQRCYQCRERLPFSEFAKNRWAKSGLANLCRKCMSDARRRLRERRVLNPVEVAPETVKHCPCCDITKTANDFPKDRTGASGLGGYCKHCNSRKRREWTRLYPKRAQETNRKTTYRLAPGQFDYMLIAQGGLCACCGGPPGAKGMQVDHCHVTGIVRALLCASCNLGLGCFQDNASRLSMAIQYLERHPHPTDAPNLPPSKPPAPLWTRP